MQNFLIGISIVMSIVFLTYSVYLLKTNAPELSKFVCIFLAISTLFCAVSITGTVICIIQNALQLALSTALFSMGFSFPILIVSVQCCNKK